MTVYLLAYDLINEHSGFDYKPLWAELNRLNAHRTQYSLWLVNLNNTPKEVAEHFRKFMDGDDRIWATRVRSNEYWFINAMNGTVEWLRKNPPT